MSAPVAALALALLLAALYGVYEVRRWATPAGRDTVTPRQRRLRLWGLACLLATLALSLRGALLPLPTPVATLTPRQNKERALRYVSFWLLPAFTFLPLVPLLLLDSRENLRRFAEERKRLLQETLLAANPPAEPTDDLPSSSTPASS